MPKFPEGREYTISLTNDELVWMMEALFDFDWTRKLGGIETAVLEKVDQANTQRQQDKAVAWLLQSSEDRNEWLEKKVRELLIANKSVHYNHN